MKKILSLLLALILLLLPVLGGCVGVTPNGSETPSDPGNTTPPAPDPPKHVHAWATVYSFDATHHWLVCSGCAEKSENAEHTYTDGVCTVCNSEAPVGSYPWEKTALLLQTSDNSSRGDLTSTSRRYLAGTSADDAPIDALVDERNTRAEAFVNVEVAFDYWPENIAKHTWSRDINEIVEITRSTNAKRPDIYCTYVYDMLGATLEGCFLNVLSSKKGTNYFRFLASDYDPSVNEEGYMYEYMSSLTLRQDKVYLIASDYFVDLTRACFALPVNLTLLSDYGAVTTDVDGDTDVDFDDLVALVEQGKWTYELLMAYCEAVAEDNTAGADARARIGFSLDQSEGGSAAALLYSSGISFIQRSGSPLTDVFYRYPDTNADYAAFSGKLEALVKTSGVQVVTKDDGGLGAIRDAFKTGGVLFGGVDTVGSLEAYRERIEDGTLGILPIPLCEAPAQGAAFSYRTQIHNVGRLGAIAVGTASFSQCTAYLNYVSTHSGRILDAYYESFGSGANAGMLRRLRDDLTSGFEKVFEDAMLLKDVQKEDLWHYILKDGGAFEMDPFCLGASLESNYLSVVESKKAALQLILGKFEDLKN